MKPYSSNSNYAERCKDFEKKKITNFERIKQMSVEDMANFLCDATSECIFCPVTNCESAINCYKNTLHWLESEAEK